MATHITLTARTTDGKEQTIVSDKDITLSRIASTLVQHGGDVERLHITNETGGEIDVRPNVILSSSRSINHTQTIVINDGEYEIYRHLIANAPTDRTRAVPYVYDANEQTGKVEYTIPLGTNNIMAGRIKTMEHNYGRKWSVQARLRQKVRGRGEAVNSEA